MSLSIMASMDCYALMPAVTEKDVRKKTSKQILFRIDCSSKDRKLNIDPTCHSGLLHTFNLNVSRSAGIGIDHHCTSKRRPLKHFRQDVTAPVLVVPFSRLRQAKPISGVILEDSFDAVMSFGGLGKKLHPLAFHLFIGSAAVVGV